jgi:hypothetical protein
VPAEAMELEVWPGAAREDLEGRAVGLEGMDRPTMESWLVACCAVNRKKSKGENNRKTHDAKWQPVLNITVG